MRVANFCEVYCRFEQHGLAKSYLFIGSQRRKSLLVDVMFHTSLSVLSGVGECVKFIRRPYNKKSMTLFMHSGDVLNCSLPQFFIFCGICVLTA